MTLVAENSEKLMSLLYDHFSSRQRQMIDELGPKMDVTNVADHYFQHDKEIWRISEDFPLCRPPFDSMWVEYRMPKEVTSKEMGTTHLLGLPGTRSYFGAILSRSREFLTRPNMTEADEVQVIPKRSETRGEWGFVGGVWCVEDFTKKIITFTNQVCGRFDMDDAGNADTFYLPPDIMGWETEEQSTKLCLMHPIFMAFTFCNCKNTEIVDVEPPAKLNKRRVERGKLPLSRYSIVNVLPFGKCYKQTRRTVSADGPGVAQHVRRGSYAKYGPQFKRGLLFGKYSGLFWRTDTKVGSQALGSIDHEYSVKVPEKQSEE